MKIPDAVTRHICSELRAMEPVLFKTAPMSPTDHHRRLVELFRYVSEVESLLPRKLEVV